MHANTERELEVYYEIHGSGPPLVNISGTGADLRQSLPHRSPFNKAFTTLHFDQRGLGQTGKPDGPYSMTMYADDVAALMDSLGWERAHVVGTSFGGMVAQHVSLRHAERVERLVLCCTSAGGISPSFPIHTLRPLDVEARIELQLGLYDCRWDPGRDDPIPGFGRFYDIMIDRMRTELDGDAHRGLTLQVDARADHDVVARLGRIGCPTLVCAGEHDDMAPLANSTLLAERIPRAELRVFDGGHFFPLQDRAAFPAMIEFLQA